MWGDNMNLKSEQLKSNLSLEIDYDEKLSKSDIREILENSLGANNCSFIKISGKNVFCYNSKNGIKELLLFKQISYLGGNGQHPIFKKRIQLPMWFKEVYEAVKNDKQYNVRFIGVYRYKNNVVFADFLKETYLPKKFNNSSAHVYINDMYQAMKYGTFDKIDKNGNKIVTIRNISFKDYIDEAVSKSTNDLFSIFDNFNNIFYPTNVWVESMKAIPEMYKCKFKDWKQVEWAGSYLEFKFEQYLNQKNITHKVKYVAKSNKSHGELDFDLWFDEDNFYGDLKASDVSKLEAPGNDKTSFIECINRYDKFWYIIYEHETKLDKVCSENFEATRFRTNFIRRNNEWDKKKPWNELSYSTKMKHSVKFVKMTIIELNRINYSNVLSDFHQGKQQSGDKRNVKVKINKRNIDNFVVFRQDFRM